MFQLRLKRMHEQDTMPIPVIPHLRPNFDERQARYRWLKALSDASGVRLLFVYLCLERGQLVGGCEMVLRITGAIDALKNSRIEERIVQNGTGKHTFPPLA
ncbi:MAG: hypothetical protein JO202_14450 [Ktedonobacteraceae bacterium]|nr:hypothetical protein [Ktedonobacteraceae bacterium]